MRKYEYIATGGETSFTSPDLIGKTILSVIKDGIGCSKVVTAAPSGNQAQYLNSTGQIGFSVALESGTDVLVLYRDAESVCFIPALQSGFTLPDINAGFPYNASFYISGTKDFTLSDEDKPEWMTITLSGDLVTFTGTPEISDVGDAEVSFTISNACGSADFDQTFSVDALDAEFGTRTYISGDRTSQVEQREITGTPGVVVTVTLTTLTNTNGGTLTVNGDEATQGDTYDITVGDVLKVEISGEDLQGTVIRGLFTITSVSAGEIGLTKTYQTSKVF